MVSTRFLTTLLRLTAASVLLAASSMLAGCATSTLYVDGKPQEIPVASIQKSGSPEPVIVHFEVQIDGVAKDPGTDKMKPVVLSQLRESGLFSSVDEKGAGADAVLTLALNKVRLAGKPGESMTDNFICTMRYQPADGKPPITTSAEQLIYTLPTAAPPPPGARKAASAQDAMTMMARTVISRTLADLARDPGFD